MNVISSGKFQEESIFSGTYTIVIDDFRKKLAAATVGRRSTTEEFIVNWTKFHIEFYIAGRSKEHKGYLSLFLSNRSDWMVRASMEIYVKVNIIVQSKEKEFGVVYNAKYGSGFGKCIPHSRCVVGDLLLEDGALIIKVKINMLGENCPGGIQTGLKRKLDEQDAKLNKQNSKLYTELLEIKSKLRKLEDNHGSEKCPMCLKVIKKPMRLQQCLQVRHDLLSNYFYTIIVRVTSPVMTVTKKSRRKTKRTRSSV